jgi:hypothetical protein
MKEIINLDERLLEKLSNQNMRSLLDKKIEYFPFYLDQKKRK